MYFFESSNAKKYLILAILLFLAFLGHWLRARMFREKKTKEPENTVVATVVSKNIKNGTHRAGRSQGGFSYVVTFLTEDSKKLELYAHDVEFGRLKEGTHGLLTYKGPYFVCFDKSL